MDGTSATVPVTFGVVIPTYNRARLIARALRCVLGQTVAPAEIIVVDDGSTDETAGVVAGFGPSVKYLQQNHGGPSRARNLGVSGATTEWIAFLDSDDIWEPDYLERMVRAISVTDGKAALYFSNAVYDYGTSRHPYWSMCGYVPGAPVELIPDGSAIAMLHTHPMLLPFTVFRKDAYLRHGGLWEELWSAEDTHLFIRMGLTEALCAVSGSGGVATADEANPENRLTRSFSSRTLKRWLGMVKMYNDLLARFPTLRTEYARELRNRLSHSHWRLSRLAWKERDFKGVVSHLWRCVRTDPGEIVRIFFSRASAHK